jgi:hypothetical protein
MKKIYFIIASALLSTSAIAQNKTVTFENFGLPLDTFNNGISQAGNSSWIGFDTLGVIFANKYDTSFGGYWSKGFAISTMRDSTTAGFTNQYSAITATGHNSSTYAMGTGRAVITTPGAAMNAKSVKVTNSTYAVLSMRNGDAFAKKFGGSTGNDSDWFMITFTGYYRGAASGTPVQFYLADYRFADSTQDYIVTTWQNVDLTPLSIVDSIVISLSSSDTGAFGMNTPDFFAIDDFTFENVVPQSVHESMNRVVTFRYGPNPATSFLRISDDVVVNDVQIYNSIGQHIENFTVSANSIDISSLERGVYYISINQSKAAKFIKQ